MDPEKSSNSIREPSSKERSAESNKVTEDRHYNDQDKRDSDRGKAEDYPDGPS